MLHGSDLFHSVTSMIADFDGMLYRNRISYPPSFGALVF